MSKFAPKLIVVSCVIALSTLTYLLFSPFFSQLVWHDMPKSDNKLHFSIAAENTPQTVEIKASEILSAKIASLNVTGLTVSVADGDGLLWQAGYGLSDIERQRNVTPLTQFRIGSTSKALTSIVLGRILEQGHLKLDDKVVDYLPLVPSHLHDITIRQLASHQSGIRNYQLCWCFPMMEYYNNTQYQTVNEALSIFQKDPLQFEPGQDFAYSSYNYTLLSALMEQATNTPFIALMDRELSQPLKLQSTIPQNAGISSQNIAHFYHRNGEQYQPAVTVNNSNKWAGGGYLSTSAELATIASQLLGGSLLSDNTKQQLFSPQKLNNGEVNPQNYGIGWRSNITQKSIPGYNNVRYIHHAGRAAGGESLLILFPEHEVSISILTNSNMRDTSGIWKLSMELASLFFEKF